MSMSPEQPTTPGSPADWLRYARSAPNESEEVLLGCDLALAQIDAPEGVLVDALCYHAQQAAEKAIKAVLLAGQCSFPFIHDIRQLLECLPAEQRVPDEVREAAGLTKYASLPRYPSGVVSVTETEHREAVRMAEDVVRWAAAQIEGESRL